MTAILLAHFFDFQTLLPNLMATHGFLVYLLLFGIIFAETGLVVTPFLPGDSILFLAGSLAALSGGLHLWLLLPTLMLAALLGDFTNFEIGKRFGHYLAASDKFKKLIKPSYLEKSETFFEKHGDFAIVIGRFTPIIRTIIPFTAGIGKMPYVKFARFNILGGVIWILVAVLSGFAFGNIPFVTAHFEIIMIAIVLISLIPAGIAWLKSKKDVAEKA
ncbi:VTT domain-containing protein [Lactococcus insecticola]|uniref:Cytochrome o ubiquinol oxidase n=1 Tax=Pseudolactococcus insecticola TaxID=2709158 RepID=A0A6A0B908_9LACT|nr:VTT domain-containing protein [Lactococcus insecticola]GFH41103.1 cytochrome o ubiquinol oxidase [Lactococcus insecticola]